MYLCYLHSTCTAGISFEYEEDSADYGSGYDDDDDYEDGMVDYYYGDDGEALMQDHDAHDDEGFYPF